MNIQKHVVAAILLLVASLTCAQTVEYIHTDALGSPVAITNSSGAVIERTVYEPYGAVINRPLNNRPGYTGHAEDAVTGLNYMQQRYYDPQLGRFLSNDPVTATSVGGNFNRYWYANNNPYKFTDPDGRTGELALAGCALTVEAGCLPGAVVGGIGDILILTGAYLGFRSFVDWVYSEEKSADSDQDPTSDSEPTQDDLGPENPPNPDDFKDPTKIPKGWEWRGKGEPGSRKGAYHNPETGESLHDDTGHPPPKPGHHTYTDSNGQRWDNFGNGWTKQPEKEPKKEPTREPDPSKG